MTNLYSMLKTNTDETLNSKRSTKKIDILFDLDANKETVIDASFDKNIICVCGSCDLLLENNGEKEALTLYDYKITVHLNKNIQAELKNCTNDARVFIQYLEEVDE